MVDTLILLSALFIAAVVGARFAHVTRIPRVVGFLVMGIGLHYGLNYLAPHSQLIQKALPDAGTYEAFQHILSLGLCLILFSIGVEFDSKLIHHLKGHIWKLSVVEAVVVSVAVFIGTWAVSGFSTQHIVGPVFLAIGAIATAPGATLLVLRQYDSKGPLTDHVLAMTGLNNLISILLFYITFLLFAELGVIHVEQMEHGLVGGILLATVASAGLGFLLGLVLSFAHALMTRVEVVLLFLAMLLLVSAASKPLGLNSLILCMFMGIAFTNFTIQPHGFRSDITLLSSPLLVLFFALAGFKLELESIGHIGAVGIAYVLMRTIGKIYGARWGVRWIGPRHHVPENLGTAMLCQAGVVIGLGKYLMDHWVVQGDNGLQAHPDAMAVNTVILASVAVYELTGPLFTKRAAVQAGEVKAISLLERRPGGAQEIVTVLGRLKQVVMPKRRNAANQADDSVTTKHLMRTNIETLNQTAKMVEVLHFVERSRLNQFFVLDDNRCFVGRIDFKDLRHLMFNPLLASVVNAFDMANTSAPVAKVDQPLEEVLKLFHDHNVDSLPVIDDSEHRRFLGVIEQRDVLRASHVGESMEEDAGGH